MIHKTERVMTYHGSPRKKKKKLRKKKEKRKSEDKEEQKKRKMREKKTCEDWKEVCIIRIIRTSEGREREKNKSSYLFSNTRKVRSLNVLWVSRVAEKHAHVGMDAQEVTRRNASAPRGKGPGDIWGKRRQGSQNRRGGGRRSAQERACARGDANSRQQRATPTTQGARATLEPAAPTYMVCSARKPGWCVEGAEARPTVSPFSAYDKRGGNYPHL